MTARDAVGETVQVTGGPCPEATSGGHVVGESGWDHEADRWLVGKARGGDGEAFEVLIRRHHGRIYRIALRMLRDPDDAEDVAQDVIIQLWTALAGFAGNSAFTTWLYRIVVNRCLNHQRRSRSTIPLQEQDVPPAVAGPEDVAIARQRVHAVFDTACPLVAGLHGGRYDHVATYLPGRRVTGIQITETELAVHVVARYPATVNQVAGQVRAAVEPHAGGRAAGGGDHRRHRAAGRPLFARRLGQGVLIVNATLIGLAVGLVLGLAAAFGGFPAFAIVAILGAVGLLVGRVLDGQLDLPSLVGAGRDQGLR